MIAYGLGFASGNYLGSYIEEKIALGYLFAYIVPKRTSDLVNKLREAGFGVTVMHGSGSMGTHPVYNILFRRKDGQRLVDIIKEHDEEAFYTLMDVRAERGGYIRAAMKRK
jgi:uncharacterized protein YebE (UPF0316 family)